jgi:hypothetical protein
LCPQLFRQSPKFFVNLKQFGEQKNCGSHLLVTTKPFFLFLAISWKSEKHLLIMVLGKTQDQKW